ncbi:hypothetical protein [uncultured Gammaproteobacteria bacterium]|nr:hypothetical protein [uncultured Gammaproteobacteria bacterium]
MRLFLFFVYSPPHRWLRNCPTFSFNVGSDSPPHRWLRKSIEFL